ncbi:putative maltose permease [Talaromyces proteolyticus]|uniref:Maltose permease n=1 Tax=Talaromyces proteolyticus TaxID=1131652 RepID=A0AAD4KEV9_9EURO|nr:putative maltose permease [Talaromyces proteolyticus]KAH8690285.1 putative maltose permease [Talaromyces proteolyticus]
MASFHILDHQSQKMDEKAQPHPIEQELSASSTGLQTDSIGFDDEHLALMSNLVPNLSDMIKRARRAALFEHQMTNLTAFKLYPKAIFFSFIFSLAIVMDGYDTSLLSSLYAYPEFQRRFGEKLVNGTYSITSSWQSGLQNGTQAGQILGLMFAGAIADRFGYRRTMFTALTLVIGFVFVLFFATNVQMLFAGEFLCGLPWGMFQILTTTYAADVSPVVLKPYLTTYVNLCWVTGQFISAGVLRGFLSRPDEWAWRIPYAIQWAWPIPILVGVSFAPESPWWLVRHGREEEARRSLLRLSSATARADSGYDVDDAIALIILTDAQEKVVRRGTSYLDCFKGVDLRRTEITCCVWMIQVFCGISFAGNVTYFLQQVGFDNNQSFSFGLGVNGIAWIGTISSWLVMQRVGRRSLYVYGLGVMLIVLTMIGFLAIPTNTPAINYASVALMMIYVFAYDITVGPVGYCLVSEIPSTRLRIKTATLARNAYNLSSIGANFLNPPILNPTAWNLKGKGGFIWAGLCLLCFAWSLLRLPEPKGRTPAEIDVLFDRKISARHFASVPVDLFRSASYCLTMERSRSEKSSH